MVGDSDRAADIVEIAGSAARVGVERSAAVAVVVVVADFVNLVAEAVVRGKVDYSAVFLRTDIAAAAVVVEMGLVDVVVAAGC